MYIGRRHIVLRDLAGADEVGHRRKDMRSVDPPAFRAQHQIVARRTPGGLLDDLGVGQAVLGEHALFLGDKQGRGISERDKAELGSFHLGARRPCRVGAPKHARFGGRKRGRRAAAELEKMTPRDAAAPPRFLPAHACHRSSSSSPAQWTCCDPARRVPPGTNKKTRPWRLAQASSSEQRCRAPARHWASASFPLYQTSCQPAAVLKLREDRALHQRAATLIPARPAAFLSE
jgi:hypothetical protein